MSISKDQALANIYGSSLPKHSDSYESILHTIQSGVEAEFKKAGQPVPKGSAFANARGDWYEIMLAAELWNQSLEHGNLICALLPNKSSLPFHEIYGGDSASALAKLFEVLKKKNVTLLASNPDFLIIRPTKEILATLPKPVKSLDIPSINLLREVYKQLRGKCDYNMVLAGLGIKTSTRPDRRQQLVQEGSVLKAIAAHFQARFWDPDYRVKYFAANLDTKDADVEALTTAATHTLVSVNMPVEPAVDALITVDKPGSVKKIFEALKK